MVYNSMAAKDILTAYSSMIKPEKE